MSGSSWSRISILHRRGYCGNGIHCTGSLATWAAGALGVLEESLEVL